MFDQLNNLKELFKLYTNVELTYILIITHNSIRFKYTIGNIISENVISESSDSENILMLAQLIVNIERHYNILLQQE